MAGNDDVAFEIRFLEKLQRLLREGDFTATYKFAVLIGLARVVVGSHHPSDVVAGAMLGIAVSQALASMARWREARSSGDG